MKFIAVLASAISVVSAQSASIAYPLDNTDVSPGQNITVQINRPLAQTSFSDVAVVLAVGHCRSSPCDNSAQLGTVLYSGPFSPQFPAVPTSQNHVPQQNFSVQIPVDIPKGQAALTLVHLSLVGAGPYTLLETKNVTLNVQ